jgi:hypothetical protein
MAEELDLASEDPGLGWALPKAPPQAGQGGRNMWETVSEEQASLVAPTWEPESSSSALYLGYDVEFHVGGKTTHCLAEKKKRLKIIV